jgi:hypothetical protein
MIPALQDAELDVLANFDELYSLAVYIPLDQPTSVTKETKFYLLSVLQDAEMTLLCAGVQSTDAQQRLKPAVRLVKSRAFKQEFFEGLVMFIHPKLFRYYALPKVSIPLTITVSRGFNLKPAQEMMSDNSLLKHLFVANYPNPDKVHTAHKTA